MITTNYNNIVKVFGHYLTSVFVNYIHAYYLGLYVAIESFGFACASFRTFRSLLAEFSIVW
jgi:hypothetical protein